MKTKSKVAEIDLLTGDVIKNGKFYVNRSNLIKHFKQITSEEAKQITINILLHRIQEKGIKYAPSTVELRSFIAPTVALLKKLKIDYKEVSAAANLKLKYNYNDIFQPKGNINKIIIDTREQNSLKFKNVQIEITKLNVGDYSTTTDLDNWIAIERKSISDLIGTISSGYERFIKEIERARETNTKLVVLVESSLTDSLSFNYNPRCKFTKCTPAFIFSRIRQLIQDYEHLQFVFVDGRRKASDTVVKILSYGPSITNFDLQYLVDTKQL